MQRSQLARFQTACKAAHAAVHGKLRVGGPAITAGGPAIITVEFSIILEFPATTKKVKQLLQILGKSWAVSMLIQVLVEMKQWSTIYAHT